MGLAAEALDDTFLVISGDALCDVDLSALVEFHKERGASVTIGLKSVENPLSSASSSVTTKGGSSDSWRSPRGARCSPTRSTRASTSSSRRSCVVPDDRPYDFSKELFPLLLEMGRPLYGYVMDGYWQDIGNLDQYRQANFDALDEEVRLDVPGIKLRGRLAR